MESSNPERRRPEQARRRAGGLCRVAVSLWLTAATVLWPSLAAAQTTPLDPGPSSSGLPGAEFVRELVGWGKWLGLGACGLVMMYGAATWAGFGSASAGRAVQGKTYVLGGLIGAAVIGLVAVVVPVLYRAASS